MANTNQPSAMAQTPVMQKTPLMYGYDINPASPYNAGQMSIERLRNLSEQRANYNAIMMRKAEDRYNAYMAEMQRRYEAANRKKPWWKKMLGGIFGGGGMGALMGLGAAPFTGGASIALGAGLGAAAGGAGGALGLGGETGFGGMMPMLAQGGMYAANSAIAASQAPTYSSSMLAPGQTWTAPTPPVSYPVTGYSPQRGFQLSDFDYMG